MKKQKDISIGGHKVLIEYNDNNTKRSEIDNNNISRLLMIRLIPNFRISESEGEFFFDQYHNFIIGEVKNVVKEN